MRYLTAGDIARLNDMVVGSEPIVDYGFLESATLRPHSPSADRTHIQTCTPRPRRSSIRFVGITLFVNGNKRTAVVAVAVFYGLNGWTLEMDQGEMVALAVDVAEGQLDVSGIAKALEGRARPRVD